MLEEQRAFLFDQLIPIIKDQEPDGILIAGDIFDKATPSAEALSLFDDFLVAVTRLPRGPEVFVISGNHDSAEQIAYGSRILDRSGLHMSPVYDGTVTPFTMKDEFGELDVYMLPFVKKATIRYCFPNEVVQTENEAIAVAVREMNVDPHRRAICIAHQFVSGSSVSGAEETNIGGLDCVGADVFSGFDYVALGHIHKPQSITPYIRYSGSPLKYSLAEVGHIKSVTIVDIHEKGDVAISEIPVIPVNDWFDLRGTFDEITSPSHLAQHPEYVEGYVRITLTDEYDIIEGYKVLKSVFPHMVDFRYDNTRTRALGAISGTQATVMTDEEFIRRLFSLQNGREMDEEEYHFIKTILECDR